MNRAVVSWDTVRQPSSACCQGGLLLDTAFMRSQDILDTGQTIAERSVQGLVALFIRRDGKKLFCVIIKKKDHRKFCWKFWKQASSDTAGKGHDTAEQHYK